MIRAFIYIFLAFFIFACNSGISENSLSENKETNTNELVKNQNTELVEKCFQDTAANIIFDINAEQSDKIIVKGTDNDIILDIDNTNLDIISVHKNFGGRYFLLCSVKDKSPEIWEIEISTGNLMYIDIDTTSINNSNILLSCD